MTPRSEVNTATRNRRPVKRPALLPMYSAMATLAWFISPWLFMLATALVVGVLYHREFHSPTLKAMLTIDDPSV